MVSGGKREGAGRPKGSGRYKQATKAVRLPVDQIDHVLKYVLNGTYLLPFYRTSVSAGFPSPAEDDTEEKLDLNELLVKKPASTFLLKVSGDSMIEAGIHSGDILIVDRSVEPSHNKIVIAAINGELTVKRLFRQAGTIKLLPENKNYEPIIVKPEMDVKIWGVVLSVIHFPT